MRSTLGFRWMHVHFEKNFTTCSECIVAFRMDSNSHLNLNTLVCHLFVNQTTPVTQRVFDSLKSNVF